VSKVKFNIYLNSKKTYTECKDIDVNSFICIDTNYQKNVLFKENYQDLSKVECLNNNQDL